MADKKKISKVSDNKDIKKDIAQPVQPITTQPITSQPITSQPITTQPRPAVAVMPQTNIPPNCPPGLEYLLQIDQLLIHQKVEILEVITGYETNNQYDIRNTFGQNVYLAAEDTDLCTRNCYGPIRPFDLRIIDYTQREVIHVYRPLRCDICCSPCCLQYVQVESPPGQSIGFVVQDWSVLAPIYHIENSAGEPVLRIEGPICTYSILCEDVEFDVLALNQEICIGRITKQWSGILREAFTDADFFGVNFPMDLDVNIKACLLAAAFLIDFMFFEKKRNRERDRPGRFHTRFMG